MQQLDRLTLLIVDDEELIREILYQYLGAQGYRVLTASTGKEALRKLSEEQVRLVVTDFRMLDMDGTVLAEAIRTDWPTVPVLIATGSHSDDLGELPDNVVKVLQKPFRQKELAEQIRTILLG